MVFKESRDVQMTSLIIWRKLDTRGKEYSKIRESERVKRTFFPEWEAHSHLKLQFVHYALLITISIHHLFSSRYCRYPENRVQRTKIGSILSTAAVEPARNPSSIVDS